MEQDGSLNVCATISTSPLNAILAKAIVVEVFTSDDTGNINVINLSNE